MRSLRILIGILTVGYFASVAACGDGDGRKSGAAGLEDAFNEATRAECACVGDQLGQAAEQMCLEELGGLLGGLDVECIDEVLSADPAARQTLNCQVNATYDLAGCLRATDCDAGNQFECDDGMMLPGEWQCDDFDDCQGGEDEAGCTPHDCGDGSEVPQAYVCDGESDCDSGSDEPGDCEYSCFARYFQRLEACGEFSEEIDNEVSERCGTSIDETDTDVNSSDTGIDPTNTDTAPPGTGTGTATDTEG